MATETVDSHQILTSDEQTVNLSSEAVKAAEKIDISTKEESVVDDREEGKVDKIHAPDIILSTSEEKAKDIQVETSVIEVIKTDKTPVHDDVKLEKESIPDKSLTEEQPSIPTESVERKATEPPPVLASVEKNVEENLKVVDTIKSPPEEQPTAEFVAREALEVPATASTEKVQEKTPEAVDVPKLEVTSSDYTVDNQAKEQPAVALESVIAVPEELAILPVPAEKVEEKKPLNIDNPELSVGPTGPEKEQPVVNVEKEQPEDGSVPVLSVERPKKEEEQIEVPKEQPEITELSVERPTKEEQHTEVPKEQPEITSVPELSVEHPKKEEQQIEVPKEQPDTTPVPELSIEPPKKEEQHIEVPKEQSEIIYVPELSTEPPKKEEQHIEILKEQAETIFVSELSVEPSEKEEQQPANEPTEVPKEKEQASEIHYLQESREVIAKNITEEVHISKETGESIEPPKNKEQPDEVHPVKESEEARDKEQSDEGFHAIESGEVKEPKEESETTPATELSVEPPKIEVLSAKEIGETAEPPLKEEQPIEVHPEKGTEHKIVKDDKEDEDRYEKTEEATPPTEEEAAKGSSTTATEVAEKSIDDKKTGEEEDSLIAETKIEEKATLIETGNAEEAEGKFDVNETPREFQESELEIKDKETVITENPKSDIQKTEPFKNVEKEVPSKPIHKQSHNILSKVKQTLVKAKKAIIGKSPSSKTISTEESRDDIKVK